jgi:dipeptidase E
MRASARPLGETDGIELLLLSNSTNYASTMFAHAADAFRSVVSDDVVTFIPFALADWDDYADRVTAAFGALGIAVESVHRSDTPRRSILDAKVVMTGGGNTFRLLDSLYGLDVIDGLGQNVREGRTRYMGASAGTNLACPTISTTNDMPICLPPTFSALGLVPFQINLHYFDADPESTFMGESREERIGEFLEENDCPVLAMYEGSWMRVSGDHATITGPAKLFDRSGCRALGNGADVSELLHGTQTFGGGRRP